MRASQLLSILLLLQNRGRMTAGEPAAACAVSVRTVYRDIDALAAAGIPVYGEPGRAGGYTLVEGFRTRLTGLTADEAGVLFLSGLPGPAADLGPGSLLATAELKVLAAPPPLRVSVDLARDRFLLDAPGWVRAGWLGALRDPRIGPALVRIHRQPEREWTVAALAHDVAMSRSAFAARFVELVGEPPMAYLARWRMHPATDQLREPGAGVGEAARRLGYGSEAAFGRAFKRVTGGSPGAVRRSAQAVGGAG